MFFTLDGSNIHLIVNENTTWCGMDWSLLINAVMRFQNVFDMITIQEVAVHHLFSFHCFHYFCILSVILIFLFSPFCPLGEGKTKCQKNPRGEVKRHRHHCVSFVWVNLFVCLFVCKCVCVVRVCVCVWKRIRTCLNRVVELITPCQFTLPSL